MAGFGDRLRQAFGTRKPAEIARKLGITYQGAKNYLEGRIPAPDALIAISASTGYSIHWLLTGDGPEKIGAPNLIADPVEDTRDNIAEELAEIYEGLAQELRARADKRRKIG